MMLFYDFCFFSRFNFVFFLLARGKSTSKLGSCSLVRQLPILNNFVAEDSRTSRV